MAIYRLGDLVPDIHPDAFVHPDAVVIGAVTIGAGASVWPTAVLRADFGRIVIGARTSIQDGTVLHATEQWPTLVGDDCVVGHNAHLEGPEIGAGCLIGSMSVTLARVVVGPSSLVGASALLTEGTVVPPGSRALGSPAKVAPLPDRARFEATVAAAVRKYVDAGIRYKSGLRRID